MAHHTIYMGYRMAEYEDLENILLAPGNMDVEMLKCVVESTVYLLFTRSLIANNITEATELKEHLASLKQ